MRLSTNYFAAFQLLTTALNAFVWAIMKTLSCHCNQLRDLLFESKALVTGPS